MSAIKLYFKQEVEPSMFKLEHQKLTDFYLSNWQTTRSVVPLLILRVILLLASLTIVLCSVISHILGGKFGFWFIYLTHWGLTSILVTTVFAVVVSARIYLYGPIGAEFRVPWYMKTFWVLYNIATPIAFMITIFYWTVLYRAGIEEEMNHGLDVAVHGINSLVMFLLLISSSVPSRLLHMYQPLLFGLVYILFGVFYHLGGGTNKSGDPYIYPVINWASPGATTLVVLITALLLMGLHFLTMVLAATRDAVSMRLVKRLDTEKTDEDLPLRQRTYPNA